MALEDVVEDILAQARKEGERIVGEGKREAEAIMEEAKRSEKDRHERFKRETERLVEDARRMEASAINLKTNKMLLQAEKDVVDKLFGEVVRRIDGMDPKRRERLTGRLAGKAIKESGDAAFIYANKKDGQFVSGLKNTKFGGAIDSAGGVVVENSARDIRTDYTFEVFLERLKETRLNEVSKRIFA